MKVNHFIVKGGQADILLTPETDAEEVALLRLLRQFNPETANVRYDIIYDDLYRRLQIGIKDLPVCQSDQKTGASTPSTGPQSVTA